MFIRLVCKSQRFILEVGFLKYRGLTIDRVVEGFWHCCLIFLFELYIISRSETSVLWAEVFTVLPCFPSQRPLPSPVPSKGCEPCWPAWGLWLGQGGGGDALWLAQHSHQWNRSSPRRAEG